MPPSPPRVWLRPVRSERVILRRDLSDVIVANKRHLGEDVVSDFWNFAEEEERKDACRGTETCCYPATVQKTKKGVSAPHAPWRVGYGYCVWEIMSDSVPARDRNRARLSCTNRSTRGADKFRYRGTGVPQTKEGE